MTDAGDLEIFADELFTVAHCPSCAVPGYVIARLLDGSTSLAELPAGTAQALGALLSKTVRAIETTVGADRVYCLSFAELDRRLHFHLFPRTAWLLEEYWRATGSREEAVNGPVLFEWARTSLAPGVGLPAGAGSVADACTALRAQLRDA